MIPPFKSFVLITSNEEKQKNRTIKPLNDEQKPLFLTALADKAQKHEATIDANLATTLQSSTFNSYDYILNYDKQTKIFSLQPRSHQIGKTEPQNSPLSAAESNAIKNSYPELFIARISLNQLTNASQASGQSISLQNFTLHAEFSRDPLILAALHDLDSRRSLSILEAAYNSFVKEGSPLSKLKCCHLILNYSLALNDHQLTLKYLDLMHNTMELVTPMLDKHIDMVIAIFKLVMEDIKTRQFEEPHEFITVMQTAILLRHHRMQIRNFKEVDLKILETILKFVEATTHKIIDEHTFSLASKNHFCIAMLLNIEEFILAAIPTLADKLKIAAAYSNRIILNKQDFEILEFAKQQANLKIPNAVKAPVTSLNQALSQEKSSFAGTTNPNNLTDTDVDLIACLEQLKYSSHYNQSPQFQNVLQVINAPNFINEDPDKDQKELCYTQIVGLLTKLLEVVLTPDHAQIFDQAHYVASSGFSLGYMATDSILTLLKYDLTKKVAHEFLKSNQLNEALEMMKQSQQATNRIKEIQALLTLYSAQN
jgi:protein-tyrosine-phosphatase